MPSYAEMSRGYGNMWRKATVTPARRPYVESIARKILQHRRVFEAVEAKTGVPWFWIGAIYSRENTPDIGKFRAVLHNGERIVGTKIKTKLVPAGRGPFATWEAAAIDALKLHKLEKIAVWNIERMLFEAERFNGWGYYNHKVNSPYVWGDTNHEGRGKYVADGRWNPAAYDTQHGVAAVLKVLATMDDGVAGRISGKIVKPPLATNRPFPVEELDITHQPSLWLGVADVLKQLWAVLRGRA